MKKESVKNFDKLTFFHIFYIFLIGSIVGWFVEGIWSLGKRHMFYNHSAFVLGHIDLVYGMASVILTLVLGKLKKCNNVIIFLVSFVVGSVLEYAASFGMEKMFGFIAWNYSSKFMNLNGRICLVYSLFWGILGIIWVRLIMPNFVKLINKIDYQQGKKFMYIALAFLAFDGTLTLVAIDRAKDYEKGIAPQNKVEECLDKYFGVDYLNNMYNNRWGKIE